MLTAIIIAVALLGLIFLWTLLRASAREGSLQDMLDKWDNEKLDMEIDEYFKGRGK